MTSSEEDCRWPVILTAHVSRLGDFVSETSPFVGVRGGLLVCGVRGSKIGAMIEGFSITVGVGAPVGVEYRALLEDSDWTPWVADGAYVGTRGVGRQIVGYAVRLVGSWAPRFQCVYAGSFAGQQDVVISKQGGACQGTAGAGLEAMQVVFRPAMRHWIAFEQTTDPAARVPSASCQSAGTSLAHHTTRTSHESAFGEVGETAIGDDTTRLPDGEVKIAEDSGIQQSRAVSWESPR